MTGAVVWLTGLPASGKTTLATAIVRALERRGVHAVRLDGDELRGALGIAGHDETTRDALYERLAGLAARTAARGVISVVAATAHKRAYRERARAQAPRFIEVWVATPISECERRDPKGLYSAARAGKTETLPGVGVPYEPPLEPDVVALGGEDRDAIDAVVELVAGAPAHAMHR